MSYERTTVDSFEVHTQYPGQTDWNHECTEWTRRRANERKREYQENAGPLAVMIKPKRIHRFALSETEQAERERHIAEDAEERKRIRDINEGRQWVCRTCGGVTIQRLKPDVCEPCRQESGGAAWLHQFDEINPDSK